MISQFLLAVLVYYFEAQPLIGLFLQNISNKNFFSMCSLNLSFHFQQLSTVCALQKSPYYFHFSILTFEMFYNSDLTAWGMGQDDIMHCKSVLLTSLSGACFIHHIDMLGAPLHKDVTLTCSLHPPEPAIKTLGIITQGLCLRGMSQFKRMNPFDKAGSPVICAFKGKFTDSLEIRTKKISGSKLIAWK